LRALEYEGFVVSERNRGFRVAPLEAIAIEELYELRSVLESHALRLAIPLLTDGDIEALDELFAEMTSATDPAALVEARDRFHSRLYATAGRSRLVEMINRLRLETARVRQASKLLHTPLHHERFYEAIKRGDVQSAVDQLVAHYDRSATVAKRSLAPRTTRGGSTLDASPASRGANTS
jgi:DNA-binding GntR family transcriptional regulator